MRIVIYLIGVFALAACSFRQPCVEELAGIEPYVESRPDSARTLLSKIDVGRLRSEGCWTYYNLLKTSAEDKDRVRHVSDSVMLRVVAYYQGRDPEKLQWAYYLLGRIYRVMGDSPRALKAFQQALDACPESQQYAILGRIYEQQFYIFSYQNLDSLALKAVKNSYRIYKIHNDSLGISFAFRNQARVFDMKQQLDSMFFYYQKAYDVACAIHHAFAEKYILSEYLSAYIDYGLIEQGEALLEKLPQDMKEKNPITLYSLGMVHRYHHRADSMVYYFQKALEDGNVYLECDIYKMLSEEAARQGDYQQSQQYAMQCIALKDSIDKITRTESIAKIHALYNYQLTEKKNSDLELENERIKRHSFTGAFFALTVIVAIYLWARHRQRLAAEQEKRLLDVQQEMKRNSQLQLEENNRRIAELEARWQNEKEMTQQELEEERAENKMLKIENERIINYWDEKQLKDAMMQKSTICKWFHTESNWDAIRELHPQWKELETMLDKIYPAFAPTLQQYCPKMRPIEWHICYLVKIEISVGGMARIVDRSVQAVSNIRKRLYEKMFGDMDASAEKFDDFIRSL